MKKLTAILMLITLPAWVVLPRSLAAPSALSDTEMDAVSAGNAVLLDPNEDAVTGELSSTVSEPATHLNNSIFVGQQAQQNLSTLVNILAVDSLVQVLLNLNVNIDSSAVAISQGNMNSRSEAP